MNRLAQLVEAALFSADSPVSLSELAALDRDSTHDEFRAALDELREEYSRLLTRREFAEAIAEAHLATRPRRLSAAALETLAIVAYRQPVGRAEIEEIRGVSVDGVLRSLQDRALIGCVGRGEGMGRPLLYGTTPAFLELLGVRSLGDLPRLEELSVALRSPFEAGESVE
ncbi:MAG: SMC-Scp complex subunit ScpB [Gemmatimonadales bacterium]